MPHSAFVEVVDGLKQHLFNDFNANHNHSGNQSKTKFQINFSITKANSTWCSEVVSHPSTTQAQCCLTLVIRREPVYSTWYGSWLIFRHNFCIFMCQQQLRFPSNCTKLTNLIKFILMQIKVKINAKFTFCRRLLMVQKSILSMIFTLI